MNEQMRKCKKGREEYEEKRESVEIEKERDDRQSMCQMKLRRKKMDWAVWLGEQLP